ncbi:MAG: glycosyltransferase family 4 protein [Bryobacteraceae bacterium]
MLDSLDGETDWHLLHHVVRENSPVAVVYGSAPGIGGLGHSVASALDGIRAIVPDVWACGPTRTGKWFAEGGKAGIVWRTAPDPPMTPIDRLWYRWQTGRYVHFRDAALAAWHAKEIEKVQPKLLYGFTQVSLDAMRWAKTAGIPTILENPNGHIRNFRRVYCEESEKLCHSPFRGHPCSQMVARVEAEYQLATYIRVYSHWAKQNMVDFGIPAGKLLVAPHGIDTDRFAPSEYELPERDGPLKLCFVGSVCLRKGVYYLLRAMRRFERDRLQLRIVGATGDRAFSKLFLRERRNLAVEAAPGDPLPAYRKAEIMVMPTLEDGFGFVVAEAMACGLPVIVTSACGASEWIKQGETGWIVPPGDEDALASAIADAYSRRSELKEMGELGRRHVLMQVEKLRPQSSCAR